MSVDISHLEVKTRLKYDPERGILAFRRTRDGYNRSWSDATIASGTKGYRIVYINGDRYSAHRMIWFWMTGEWPERIDHINGKPGDNRWENLRVVTAKENSRNHRKPVNNTSGYVGVRRYGDKWRARIGSKHLGYFKRLEDALEARYEAEKTRGYTQRHWQKSPPVDMEHMIDQVKRGSYKKTGDQKTTVFHTLWQCKY